MTRNSEVLADFIKYCEDHPTERFWQALRNWSDHNFILVSKDLDGDDFKDTFYWEGKSK